jgi:D-alanyl-D-alanine endopeptidase (penicillin-binding protein 7)
MKKYIWILLFATTSTALARVPALKQDNSVLIYNINRDKIEYSHNADQVRAIASITKIMTAMVSLDSDKDLSRKLTLSRRVSSGLPKQQYTREQLLNALLVRSDNAAAETLAEDFPGGRKAFVAEMNRKARQWDMVHTNFDDPSGLSPLNISTVTDVANMMHISSGYWFIRDTSNKKQVAFETRYKKKIRTISLAHTSGPLLFAFDNVIVSKTGLTNAAGWCVGLVADQNQEQYVIVVLGSRNKAERLSTVKDLRYNHIVDNQLNDFKIPIYQQ